jgi:hypothetical protein
MKGKERKGKERCRDEETGVRAAYTDFGAFVLATTPAANGSWSLFGRFLVLTFMLLSLRHHVSCWRPRPPGR